MYVVVTLVQLIQPRQDLFQCNDWFILLLWKVPNKNTYTLLLKSFTQVFSFHKLCHYFHKLSQTNKELKRDPTPSLQRRLNDKLFFIM